MLGADELGEAKAWLDIHQNEIPTAVVSAIRFGLELSLHARDSSAKLKSLLTQFRRALGITASSEKRKSSGDPLAGAPKDARASEKDRLIRQRNRSNDLRAWYRGLARRHDRKAKNAAERLMKLEDIELTEQDKIELVQEGVECDARMELGQRCDLDAAKSAESLMRGVTSTVETEPLCLDVDREGLPKNAVVKQQFYEDRERIDFSFAVTKYEIAVEKLAIQHKDGSATLVSASLDEIGPPKMRVTWDFLANMAILVCQYAMPLNRFAELASSEAKRFTGGEMSRYFYFVASHFSKVYVNLGLSLANPDVLLGDDTPSRVVEVSKALKKLDAKEIAEEALPWASYGSVEKAQKLIADAVDPPDLGAYLAQHFGFESAKKDGKGNKRAINTTVLSGRVDTFDPKSLIVFYRSHLGSLGNLLDVVLKKRRKDNNQLVMQTDLSTTNLITDPTLTSWLSVTQAGCSYHARRPFALHEDDDPDLCAYILHSFKGLAIFEGGLDAAGRNVENTIAVRTVDEKAAWEQIKSGAELIARKWAKGTPLGDGAHYILRHFERLTYYLRDHRLMSSNNFSERMLRIERLIENGALFRQTLEGRFALDIMRSVIQTAIAAGANPKEYITWVMRMPIDVVASAPHEFTPRAYIASKPQNNGAD